MTQVLSADAVGAAADVFSALGTVGAFAVSLVLLAREQRRGAELAAEERRAQAVRVSAWVEPVRAPSGAPGLVLCVHNASDMPIYEVGILATVPDGDVASGDRAEAGFIGLVPPGQTVRRPAPAGWVRHYAEAEPVEIEFRDGAGRRWCRDDEGTLRVGGG